jgi:hypothetical protein
MRAKLKMIKEEMGRRMHQPIPQQGKWLWYVVNGYFKLKRCESNNSGSDRRCKLSLPLRICFVPGHSPELTPFVEEL